MKKRILAAVICLTMLLVSVPFVGVSAGEAAAPAKEGYANYYEWNFQQEALNNNEKGVYTANSGNNALTVKTSKDTAVWDALKKYHPDVVLEEGGTVKPLADTALAALGNALHLDNRYALFSNEVVLVGDVAWEIEITGRLPQGTYRSLPSTENLVATQGKAAAAILANDATGEYIEIDGAARAFYIRDGKSKVQATVDGVPQVDAQGNPIYVTEKDANGNDVVGADGKPVYKMKENIYSLHYAATDSPISGAWNGSGRLGQHRVQTLKLWNQKHDDGTWHIHWMVTECYNSNGDAWNNQDSWFNMDTTNVDFKFAGIGSEKHYCGPNNLGANKPYASFISGLKVWENTAANNAVSEGATYTWTFEDAKNNDLTNGIFTSDEGTNKIIVGTPTDLTTSLAMKAEIEKANGKYNEAGIKIAAAERISDAAVVERLGNSLYYQDRYLQFEKPVILNGATPWKVILTGSLPCGMPSRDGKSQSKGGLLVNENGEGIWMDGNGRAFWIQDKSEGGLDNVTHDIQVGNGNAVGWDAGCRLGQHRIPTLEIWNQQHDDGTWHIHWMVTDSHNSVNDAWIDKEAYYKNDTTGMNLVLTGLTSNTYYAHGNRLNASHYVNFFSEVKIWENTVGVQAETIEAIPNTVFSTPTVGIKLADKVSSLGEIAAFATPSAVVWKSGEDDVTGKAAKFDTEYTATVTLAPATGYAFVKDTTKVPDIYTATFNDDGTLTLTFTFKTEPEETDPPETEPATPEVTAPVTNAPADGTDAPVAGTDAGTKAPDAATEEGCASSVAFGAFGIFMMIGAAAVVLKKKED